MFKTMYLQLAVIAFAAAMVFALAGVQGQVAPQAAVAVDNDDIGGVVTGPRGPEAGVWVVAETRETQTRLIKIVVTDDRGRYLIPDLPKANYNVWVRGYGLIDSPKIATPPGKIVNPAAMPAPSAAAAAVNYPPIYWFSMMKVPPKSDFPLPKIKSQGEWLTVIKSGACQSCHPLGTPGMRTIRKELGEFQNSADAWAKRLQAGSAMNLMARDITRLDTQIALKLFGDWTDRIAAGELPFAKPDRPKGVERNAVIRSEERR